MIVHTFYISTGRKNAMYTLRFQRGAFVDSYVCNLSTDEVKAAEKGQAYADAFRDRVGESDSFKVVFADTSGGIFERRGKLSARDTHCINMIEDGVFPFGKHQGSLIANAPDSYVLFFADKVKEEDSNAVTAALAAACLGVALERGLIAKRDAIKAERKAQDELSQHVGTIKERRVFTGEVVYSIEKDGEQGYYHINKIRCGNDIIVYVGNKLACKGDTVTFKATIVKHDEYQGVKSTKVNRPANVEVTPAAGAVEPTPVATPVIAPTEVKQTNVSHVGYNVACSEGPSKSHYVMACGAYLATLSSDSTPADPRMWYIYKGGAMVGEINLCFDMVTYSVRVWSGMGEVADYQGENAPAKCLASFARYMDNRGY